MESSLNQPLVSVCVPCHNAADFVGSAIQSVIDQTWKSLEIIAVNDGSTDESEAILERLAAKHSNIVKVVSNRCGSAAKARNLAFQHSKGSLIKFFDADDLMSPQMIEKQVLRLNSSTESIVSCEWGRFYDNNIETFELNPEPVWCDMKGTDWLVSAWENARPMTQPGIFLIPRKLIERHGPWDESLTLIDDFEFFTRMISNAKKVLFTEGVTLFYRSGISGSLSNQQSRPAVESAFHSLLKGTEHLLAIRNDAESRRSCSNIYQDFVYTYFWLYPDLCRSMSDRIVNLGGSSIEPEGSPNFHRLRRILGWKIARQVEHCWRNFRGVA